MKVSRWFGGLWLALAGCGGLVATAEAQTSYPMLMGLKPVAAQVGKESVHEVRARYNLWGASAVIVSGEGVQGEVVTEFAPPDESGKKPSVSQIQVKFTVAPDALPGVRDFRLMTPQGPSTIGQLVITSQTVVVEADKNDTLEQAQPIELPAAFCGTIEKTEDMDFVRFEVEAGTALVFHVYNARLQDRIHDLQTHSDPIITIRNAQGATVAQSDNYYFADPLLHHRFETGGPHTLEIRDVRYQGNGEWHYCIEMAAQPRVTHVHPLGLVPGPAVSVEAVGFNLPQPSFSVQLPEDAAEGPQWIRLPLSEGPSNPVQVYAHRLPSIVEPEGDNDAAASAVPVAVPCVVSGRIERESDVDCYVFEAKKDQKFTFDVVARRLMSDLDPILRILKEDGSPVTENDDATRARHPSADSLIENWTAPADGKYVLEIRDLHLRGGASFVYALRAEAAGPHFLLQTDTDKTLVSPGGSAPIFVRAIPKNGFTGEIQLAIEGLPAGVEPACGKILLTDAGKPADGCIVLTAAGDAPRGFGNVKITGTAKVPGAEDAPPLVVVAEPLQEIYLPGGGRGHYPADLHCVGVNDVLDVKEVTLSTYEITLQPGQSQKIDVQIQRAEGFDKNVTLAVVYQHLGQIHGNALPAGVTLDEKDSNTLLTGTNTQGHITLKCAADAKPVEKQQFVVMAHVSINFVMKTTYSSRPVLLTILPGNQTAAK